MNLSWNTLRSLVPGLENDPEQIAERLREREIEVERVAPLKELLEPIVVARVEAVTPHPNADRLRICEVNDGGEAPLQIVTGAPNVEAGAYFPLIRTGTRLPNGTKIRKGKLRGEVSEGMLGSARELELGEDQGGLMRLSGELEPGTPLTEVVETPGWVLILGGKPEEDEIVAALS